MLLQAPFTALRTAIATAIAALADYWGEVDNKMHLMMNDPAITSTTVVGDFTEATFGGYAAKAATVAGAAVVDALTGNLIIRIADPAGGWSFLSSGAPPANIPQTIYGAYVTNAAGDILLGAVKFTDPVTITAAGQIIDVDDCTWAVANPPVGV